MVERSLQLEDSQPNTVIWPAEVSLAETETSRECWLEMATFFFLERSKVSISFQTHCNVQPVLNISST